MRPVQLSSRSIYTGAEHRRIPLPARALATNTAPRLAGTFAGALFAGALLAGLLLGGRARAQAPTTAASWPWLTEEHQGDTLEARFAPPEGFARVDVPANGFGAFLRRLPLAPAGTKVRAFDGRVLGTAQLAVIALDVGQVDLQQCADSAIRLYAEHLWSQGARDRIAFHTTSGDLVPFSRYAKGEQIAVKGNKVGWRRRAAATRDDSVAGAADRARDRALLRRYLDDVFMYAGSLSLALDTVAVNDAAIPGDLYVVGGSPGHVLVVLDVVARGQERRLLLGEGFMPAQSFHVVPGINGEIWVKPGPDGAVRVPTWPAPFSAAALRRFKER